MRSLIGYRGIERPARLGMCLTVLACLGAWPGPARAAAPVASDAAYTVEPGSALAITLVATDADGDPLSYIITTPLPTLGEVSVSGITLTSDDLPYTIPANGKVITFTAGSDAHGNAAIKFKVNDGTSDSEVATVTVTVNLAPIAAETTTFFTEPNTDLKFDLPAEDPDGDTLSYTITSLPGHGSLKIGSATLADAYVPYAAGSANVTFVPDADFHGQDQFTFPAADSSATSASITSVIEVNTMPVPAGLTFTVLPGGSVTIVLTAEDADKDSVSFVIASLPDHATLILGGQAITEDDLPQALAAGINTVVYEVDASYRGTDTFHYRANDGVSTSSRAVVTISVNSPPVAPSLTYTVLQNTAIADVLTPTDADGDALTVRITRLGTHGTLKLDDKTVTATTSEYAVPAGGLSFNYTLDTDFEGEDSFAWVANDRLEDSPVGEVTISVSAVDASTPDDPPEPEPTPEPPVSDETAIVQEEEETTDTAETDAAPAECGPIGGSLVLMTATWALVITPRLRLRRRLADPGSN